MVSVQDRKSVERLVRDAIASVKYSDTSGNWKAEAVVSALEKAGLLSFVPIEAPIEENVA